ncbi:regulator of G-protein signaling 13-like [Tachyglossus aculeatus]|uniref:regulator of G-protein signaling 13-like n=1 Tax=Tachyglossus aculeatus TaxID=9261 RepID=UPI0018F34987|nr:regulator of G-protein signaling 13-like [Tachyglossus aculeatus]
MDVACEEQKEKEIRFNLCISPNVSSSSPYDSFLALLFNLLHFIGEWVLKLTAAVSINTQGLLFSKQPHVTHLIFALLTTQATPLLMTDFRLCVCYFKFTKLYLQSLSLNVNGALTLEPSCLTLEEVFQWSQSFDKLMSTKHGPVFYGAYLKTEHSDENIKFWTACETYKKISSRKGRLSKARKLYKMYIQPKSPKEINIDSPTRKAIDQNIQEPTEACFDEAQKIVYLQMERDSYPRFLKSEIYQKLFQGLQAASFCE